jgi:HrpA-like RNA helicase
MFTEEKNEWENEDIDFDFLSRLIAHICAQHLNDNNNNNNNDNNNDNNNNSNGNHGDHERGFSVLVFLPGWKEILEASNQVEQMVLPYLRSAGLLPHHHHHNHNHNRNHTERSFNEQEKDVQVHLLHSSVPPEEQRMVFEPLPNGIKVGIDIHTYIHT